MFLVVPDLSVLFIDWSSHTICTLKGNVLVFIVRDGFTCIMVTWVYTKMKVFIYQLLDGLPHPKK